MSYVEKNPWILHFDGSGCSGCGMEVQACFSPKFDVEQYGVRKTDNPKHADVLLITGIVEEENRDYLVHLYENMAEPEGCCCRWCMCMLRRDLRGLWRCAVRSRSGAPGRSLCARVCGTS